MGSAPTQVYEFGDFRLDAVKRLLWRKGEPVSLPPKVFDLLLLLVESHGRELKKDELMRRLWPDCYVEESNLTQYVFLLRKALGQRRGENRLIVTIPGRGYRLVEVVRQVGEDGETISELTREPNPTAGAAAVRSIAVLPFMPLVAGVEDKYLGLGMADAIINRLSHIQQIAVRPTDAILKYTDSAPDPIGAGRELDVDALLIGKFQRAGERIRVTVQLVNVRAVSLLWAEKFEEHFANIFAVQDSISEQVGQALTLRLSGEERQRLTRRETDSPEAYQSYLKGRYHSAKWTYSGWTKGIEHFSHATEVDPNYALAYAGLAEAFYIVSNLYLPPREAMPKAKAAALKALGLGETLAEAHTSLALVQAFYDWDWLAAEREFQRALELNPGYASAHRWYGRYLTTLARFDEAITELRRAQQLDPLSPSINAELGRPFLYTRQYSQAIAQLQETLELEPNFWPAHLFLGWAYEQQGQFTEAIAILSHASALDDNPRTLSSLGHAYAAAGQKDQAQKVLDELVAQSQQRYVSPYYIAAIYTGLGEKDLAFTWLEQAYQDQSEWLVWLKVDPRVDGLRPDSRFANLLRRVGLTSKAGGSPDH
jgi:DNA-binding winged helix-turn-helix (wHTH) protein/Tfp pilus assembly protein PilF